MSVIFKNLKLKETILKLLSSDICSKIFNFLKTNRTFVRTAVLVAILISALSISTSAVGITLGFDISYKGEVVATVGSSKIFENAKNLAVDSVNGDDAQKNIEYPKLKLTVAIADKLDNAEKVANVIIENSDKIVSASALVINGEVAALMETDTLNGLLESRKNAFNIEGAENESSFVDEVEVKNGFYLKSDIWGGEEAEELINNLQVKTVSTVVTEISVPFTVKEVKTNSQNVGYCKITTAGKNGLNRKTEVIEQISGEEVSKTQASLEVISKPTQQVITVGTAPVKVPATEKANASSVGFIFPLSKGKYTVTSYWGDGRGHKGVDLAAKSGVAIFAVADGKVSYAGWHKDYGYNVIIEHNNGIKTRYAHAKALCVSTGDTVSQGDMIATVGNTGYSLGSHLHFEVIINGTRVNPAPYIGLK